MSVDLAALKAEIESDPLGIYPAFTPENDAAVAAAINEVRDTISIYRDDLEASELKDAIVLSDYEARCDTQAKRDWLALVLDNGIPVQDPNGAVRSGIVSLFSGTPTLAAFASIAQRDASRAEDLWGPGVNVSPSDVAGARTL